jgi:hypothetical protein
LGGLATSGKLTVATGFVEVEVATATWGSFIWMIVGSFIVQPAGRLSIANGDGRHGDILAEIDELGDVRSVDVGVFHEVEGSGKNPEKSLEPWLWLGFENRGKVPEPTLWLGWLLLLLVSFTVVASLSPGRRSFSKSNFHFVLVVFTRTSRDHQ